jgi:subtilase family serine protease
MGAVQGELSTAKLSVVLRIIAGALLIVLRTRR